MAEYSRPYPGTTIGDAGPYAAAEWWDVWLANARTGGRLSVIANYDLGVFYAIANALEPTSNVTEIEVDTGASLVDGLYHENNATVSVPIPAAGAGDSRIDIVVVRKNYQQAITYTPGGGAPTVPPRTARITVVRGTEDAAPVAPSLTQDTTRTTYWDIPLAQVEVDDGGNLSDFTDLREFIDAEYKHFFVHALAGYNSTDVSGIAITAPTIYPPYPALILPDNKIAFGNGRFIMPTDYISDLTITAEIWPGAAGNTVCDGYAEYRECLENTYHSDSFAKSTVAVTQSLIPDPKPNCIAQITLTNAGIDDVVNINFRRYGNDANDNLGQSVYLTGWIVEYWGWKK